MVSTSISIIIQDRLNRNVCIVCTEDLGESFEEVALKADTDGMIALTEYEQCFLYGKAKGMCPECLESEQNTLFKPTDIKEGDAMFDPSPEVSNGG